MNVYRGDIYVTPYELELLRGVWELRHDWDGGWVSSYDLALAIERRRVKCSGPADTRWLGMSMLPVMARSGILDTQHRAGCVVMYRVNDLGRRALRKRKTEDGVRLDRER